MKRNLKLILFVSIQFSVVLAIVLIVLFAGKKMYTVTFELNGGTYISGDLVQKVRYGKSANSPMIIKDGCYFLSWSTDFDKVTKDITVYPIWEYETSYGIEFEIIDSSNYCLISGCYENVSGDIYIGSYYQGKRVLGIKNDAFKNCKNINGIYLLDGIVSIGDNAFDGCTNLKNIVIPSTVETIGKNILRGCTSLEKLSFPFIGDSIYENTTPYFGYLFGGTSYLNGYRKVPKTLKNIEITKGQDIPSFSFYKCSNIEDVKITGKVKKICSNAFRNCTNLKSISFSKTIETIENASFANCTSLTKITLPDNLTVLSEATFANCTSLEYVKLNNNLISIAPNSFQNCSALTKIDINKNKNFITENGKIYFVNDGSNIEYKIDLEVYTDDVDSYIDIFPPIIQRPTFDKIVNPDNIFDNDETIDELKPGIDDLFNKDEILDNIKDEVPDEDSAIDEDFLIGSN